MSEPVQVKKKAIDVLPSFNGIYCAVDGGEPFVNHIELRHWSEDGTQIVFLLSSFNFLFAYPDEEIDVIELTPHKYCNVEKIHTDDDEFRKKKPLNDVEFARAWAL